MFITSFHRSFNDYLADYHLYLDKICLLHAIDYGMHFSAVYITASAKVRKADRQAEVCWLGQLWIPRYVYGDVAFNRADFKTMMNNIQINYRLVSHSRRLRN